MSAYTVAAGRPRNRLVRGFETYESLQAAGRFPPGLRSDEVRRPRWRRAPGTKATRRDEPCLVDRPM